MTLSPSAGRHEVRAPTCDVEESLQAGGTLPVHRVDRDAFREAAEDTHSVRRAYWQFGGGEVHSDLQKGAGLTCRSGPLGPSRHQPLAAAHYL